MATDETTQTGNVARDNAGKGGRDKESGEKERERERKVDGEQRVIDEV